MTKFAEDSARIAQGALSYLRSDYGKYRMEILEGMIDGALSSATNPTEPYPDRYLARYAALKELKDSIQGDLESDTPSHQT